MKYLKEAWSFLLEIFTEFNDDNCFRWAAALAYYTVFSMVPTIIILMWIVGFFFGQEAVQGQVYGELSEILGRESAAQVQEMVERASDQDNSFFTTIVSLVTLFFGATAVFFALKDSLNIIWKVKAVPKSGIVKMAIDRILSFAMILSVGFIMLVSLLLNALLAVLGNYIAEILPQLTNWIIQILNMVISFGVTIFLFAMIYKVLPDVKIWWKEVWIGAIVTAFLFTVGKLLLGIYFASADVASTYGAAGSIILMLLWVQYSALVIFFGAEFTFVYAKRYGHKILPSEHAVRVERKEIELGDIEVN